MSARSEYSGTGARPHPGAGILAAGALLYTHRDSRHDTRPGPRAGGEIQVAVIHRPRHDDWTFPKGKLEPGEHVLAAAVREVTEETGIRPVLGPPLATVRYQVEGRPKRVDYWAARVDEPPAGPFVPNDEVNALEWLPAAAAAARLSYAHDVQLLDRLLPVAGAGTVPCILLRHASAGSKGSGAGDDLLRPLDTHGAAEAQALAGLLACYAPGHVISSTAERCLATVHPYAERAGVAVEAEPAFTVGPAGLGDRAWAARQRMTELIKQPSSMVICGHRENLPVLLGQALADLHDDGATVGGWSPAKGAFCVLHVAGGRLAALERHDLRG